MNDPNQELREYVEMILTNIISHTAKTEGKEPYTLTANDCKSLAQYLPTLLSTAHAGRAALEAEIQRMQLSAPPPMILPADEK